ncbi:reverse transcriptase domain-containing protein [Rhizobium ruizarguesonis]|uniref:reverse transcriptase domain-containing protein n=1 Tax=Rhizobium ruizarguesonis TaxID=2081791 RepID=UPI001031D8AA|nr:reverse transcriptase domain-containing protein [Rhizobium ruizarguesonis]TAU01483.1 hypothetical protein ELI53_19090 [Rhizobium ruizarguesonis]
MEHSVTAQLSRRDRRRGTRQAERLQTRIARAEAEGKGRKARSLRRLFARSYSVALGLTMEEMARQNARQRRPVITGSGSQIDCNALQRGLTGEIWFDEELGKSEVIIPKFADEEMISADIIQVRPTSGRRHWRRWRNRDARRKASSIQLGHAPGDRYTVFSVKKSSGGIRPIHAYGVTDRVRQRLLLMAYGDRLPINENIYSARGNGGRPAAITEVVRRIDAGAKWAAVLDIKNFFGAADRGWLVRKLPMPKAYIRSTVLQEDTSELEGRFMRDCTGIARTRARLIIEDQMSAQDVYGMLFKSQAGLPQGAATSATLASHIITDAMKMMKLPYGVFLIVYADDMLLLGDKKADVEKALLTLSGTLSSHPGGPFELHEQRLRRASDGFDFLGMSFRRRGRQVDCVPDAEALKKAQKRIISAALECIELGQTVALERSVAGVVASFTPWRARLNWLWRLLNQLKRMFPELHDCLGAAYARLRAAAQAELSRI